MCERDCESVEVKFGGPTFSTGMWSSASRIDKNWTSPSPLQNQHAESIASQLCVSCSRRPFATVADAMSVCRPASCLFRRSAASIPKTSSASSLRPFHSTSIRHARRRTHYDSLPATELAVIDEDTKYFSQYTEEELRALRHHYTPEQLEALKVAEKAIDLRDLVTQGAFRGDHWRPTYLDDFTTLDPFLDKKQVKEPTYAGRVKMIDENTFRDQFQKRQEAGDEDPRSTDELFRLAEHRLDLPEKERKLLTKLKRYKGTDKEAAIRTHLQKYAGRWQTAPHSEDESEVDNWARTGADPHDPLWLVSGDGKERGLDDNYSALAPEIPKFDDPRIRWPFGEDDDANAAGLKRLGLQTGFSQEQIRRFTVKNLVTHRVVNQTRMGKIASMYNLTIAGNRDGLLGIGEGKSAEPEDSMRQARMNAIRNMKPIHRYEDRTIFGEVKGKVGAVEVQLSARPPGTSPQAPTSSRYS
jgi:small subunit ribosomal protein S5